MKKNEKRTLITMFVSIALLLGAGLWWGRINAEPDLTMPQQRLPEPNAFDFYVKAGATLSSLSATTPGSGAVDPVTDSFNSGGLTPQQLAKRYPTAGKVKWLKTCAPVLKTLRQGFAYEYVEPRPTKPGFSSYYSQYRSLARLLSIENHARSEQGDWAGAAGSSLDALKLGHDIPRGGGLISALVGYAVGAIGRRQFETVIPHLDAAASRAAARRIEGLEASRFPYADTLQADKWLGLMSLRQSMRGSKWRSQILPAAPGSRARWVDIARLYAYSKRDIMNNQARYLDALSAQARLPLQKRHAPPPPTDPVNRELSGIFERAGWNAARDQTGNLTLMLQLALRAFQLEHGHYPDTLTELTGSYLKKVPADPFGSGEALRYHSTGNTYLLYSIGPDGKDDGGKAIMYASQPATSRNRYLMQPDSTGDYVAGVNH